MNIHKWIEDNLGRDSVVVEAGTCDGTDTHFFSNYFTSGKIYGFEPIPSLYDRTINRVSDKKNVTVLNAALSDKTGKVKIHVSDRFGESFGSSSILSPKDHLIVHPEISFKDEIEVDSISLDDWFDRSGVSRIDLLWLDMQGYEPIVLSSGTNTLKNVRYLYTEVSLIETYDGVILYPDYKEFLFKNGFEIVYEDLPWVDMGNVLFKNKKIL